MEANVELICCAGCGAPLDVDGELIKCKECGQTNLLGERAARALKHLKGAGLVSFLAPGSAVYYSSAMVNSVMVYHNNSYATGRY